MFGLFFLYLHMRSKIQKASRYKRLYNQAEPLLRKSPSLIAQFATIHSEKVIISITGYYLVENIVTRKFII